MDSGLPKKLSELYTDFFKGETKKTYKPLVKLMQTYKEPELLMISNALLSNVLMSQGKYDEAKEPCKNSLKNLQSSNGKYIDILINLFYSMNKEKDLILAIEGILKENPKSIEIYGVKLILLLIKNNEFAKINQYCNSVEKFLEDEIYSFCSNLSLYFQAKLDPNSVSKFAKLALFLIGNHKEPFKNNHISSINLCKSDLSFILNDYKSGLSFLSATDFALSEKIRWSFKYWDSKEIEGIEFISPFIQSNYTVAYEQVHDITIKFIDLIFQAFSKKSIVVQLNFDLKIEEPNLNLMLNNITSDLPSMISKLYFFLGYASENLKISNTNLCKELVRSTLIARLYICNSYLKLLLKDELKEGTQRKDQISLITNKMESLILAYLKEYWSNSPLFDEILYFILPLNFNTIIEEQSKLIKSTNNSSVIFWEGKCNLLKIKAIQSKLNIEEIMQDLLSFQAIYQNENNNETKNDKTLSQFKRIHEILLIIFLECFYCTYLRNIKEFNNPKVLSLIYYVEESLKQIGDSQEIIILLIKILMKCNLGYRVFNHLKAITIKGVQFETGAFWFFKYEIDHGHINKFMEHSDKYLRFIDANFKDLKELKYSSWMKANFKMILETIEYEEKFIDSYQFIYVPYKHIILKFIQKSENFMSPLVELSENLDASQLIQNKYWVNQDYWIFNMKYNYCPQKNRAAQIFPREVKERGKFPKNKIWGIYDNPIFLYVQIRKFYCLMQIINEKIEESSKCLSDIQILAQKENDLAKKPLEFFFRSMNQIHFCLLQFMIDKLNNKIDLKNSLTEFKTHSMKFLSLTKERINFLGLSLKCYKFIIFVATEFLPFTYMMFQILPDFIPKQIKKNKKKNDIQIFDKELIKEFITVLTEFVKEIHLLLDSNFSKFNNLNLSMSKENITNLQNSIKEDFKKILNGSFTSEVILKEYTQNVIEDVENSLKGSIAEFKAFMQLFKNLAV